MLGDGELGLPGRFNMRGSNTFHGSQEAKLLSDLEDIGI